jgi:hypothetical protein
VTISPLGNFSGHFAGWIKREEFEGFLLVLLQRDEVEFVSDAGFGEGCFRRKRAGPFVAEYDIGHGNPRE